MATFSCVLSLLAVEFRYFHLLGDHALNHNGAFVVPPGNALSESSFNVD
jgi:hypothetical protein